MVSYDGFWYATSKGVGGIYIKYIIDEVPYIYIIYMETQNYPLTFIDYTIIVPAPGIIMFDEEINPDHLCVRDGDTFEVVITNGKIMFRGISRKNNG